MHEIQPSGDIIIASLRSSLSMLEPESERALEEASRDLTRSTRFYEEEKWEEEWRDSTPSPLRTPIPLAIQISALEYRVAELEDLLKQKERILKELMEQDSRFQTFDNAHFRVKLFSIIGILCLSFTLAVYFLTGILIVNPIFGFFGIIACVMFWLMAAVDGKANRKR